MLTNAGISRQVQASASEKGKCVQDGPSTAGATEIAPKGSLLLKKDTKSRKMLCEGHQKEMFMQLYPVTPAKEMARMFGVSLKIVRRIGRELGLKRDENVSLALRSERLKEMWKSEKRRIAIGLSQNSRLVCPVEPYSEIHHGIRHRARRRGYVVGDPYEFSGERYTIYFTEESRRSAIFERHCVQHGIAVKDFESRKR